MQQLPVLAVFSKGYTIGGDAKASRHPIGGLDTQSCKLKKRLTIYWLSDIELFQRSSLEKKMDKLIQPAVVRGVVLTLVGAAGALIGIIWPVGQKAFCSGIQGLVL